MEMIVLDEEAKAMGGNTYIQNIATVNGSASQQNNGVINTYNTTNDTSSMLELMIKLLAHCLRYRALMQKKSKM